MNTELRQSFVEAKDEGNRMDVQKSPIQINSKFVCLISKAGTSMPRTKKTVFDNVPGLLRLIAASSFISVWHRWTSFLWQVVYQYNV